MVHVPKDPWSTRAKSHTAHVQGTAGQTCKDPWCTCPRNCSACMQGAMVHMCKELCVCVCVCALTSTLPAGCRWLATVTPSHMSSMMYLSGSPGRARCESWGGDPLHPPHRPQSSRAGEADMRAHPGGVWGGSHALFSSMSSRSQSLLEGERGQA